MSEPNWENPALLVPNLLSVPSVIARRPTGDKPVSEKKSWATTQSEGPERAQASASVLTAAEYRVDVKKNIEWLKSVLGESADSVEFREVRASLIHSSNHYMADSVFAEQYLLTAARRGPSDG